MYCFSNSSKNFFVNIKGGTLIFFCPVLVSEKGGKPGGDTGKSEYVNMVSFSNSFDEGSIVSYVLYVI